MERNEEPGSAFDRLPEDLKEEIHRKEREQEDRGEEYRKKIQKLSWYSAALGGLIAAVLAFMAVSHPLMWFIVGIYGGAATFLIAALRLDHLKGIFLFGAGSNVLLLLGCAVGLVVWGPSLFFVWLFYLTGGALIAIAAEGQRQKIDGY